MYLIEKTAELTPDRVGKIIMQFQTKELPRLNRWFNYNAGKQAILRKKPTDVGKPCNKIVVNYCDYIVQNYLGYLTGIGIDYQHDEDISELLDILNYNDVKDEDSELLRLALIAGHSYECNYIDGNGKQRFKTFDPRECISVYDTSLEQELLYVIRFWKEDRVEDQLDSYFIEVYGPNDVKKYRSAPGFTTVDLISEESHYYGMCPVTEFKLNNEDISIFEKIMSLQDAYNNLISGGLDDFDSFADAYMVIKGMVADEDDLENMKKHRVLCLDLDADAQYLTKNVSDTAINDLLQLINDQIHKISQTPDFNDEKFMSQSGISIKYKLIGFENKASDIESHMKKALQRRIELICNIMDLTEDNVWRDISINFHRNLPENVLDIAQMVNNLRGIVSQETLLSQIPFVTDIDAEMERVRAENEANMALYSFGVGEEDEELLEEEDTGADR